METRTSPRSRPGRPSLSERSDRQRVGADRTRRFRRHGVAGAGDRSTCAKFSTRSSTCFRQAASGKPCRKTCRRRAPRISISCCGTGTARWSASTRCSMWRCVKRPGAKRARRPRSSTARAPRQLKKGFFDRPARLRRGQEGHGPQAAHPRRHARSPAGVVVLPANIQDRDGTRDLLRRVRRRFPFIERIFADAGYQGPKMAKTSPRPAPGGSRSSSETICTASSSYPNDGSSSAHSPG